MIRLAFPPALPALLGVALVTSCGAELAPISPEETELVRVATPVRSRHLVAFTSATIPSGFAARVAALGGTIENRSAVLGFAAVRGLTASAAAALAREAGVASVEPELIMRFAPAAPRMRPATSVRPRSHADPASAMIFADLQWGLQAIRALEVWAAGRLGSSSTRVAILDTGIDYTHPDLAGLVDLDASVDLIGDATAIEEHFGPGFEPIADLNGHGTLVASIVSSNGILAAGVTAHTELVAVKVCHFREGCPFGAIFEGMQYVADQGIPILNMSIGGPIPRDEIRGQMSVATRAFAYLHRKGTLAVVAATNEAIDYDHDDGLLAVFCDIPNVVCVSATGPTGEGSFGPYVNPDAVAFYTNYGRSIVSLAAPGGNGVFDGDGNLVDFTPVWGPCSRTLLIFQNPEPTPGEPPPDKPCSGDPLAMITPGVGTSFASPHVAGTAALIADRYRGNPDALRARLQQTARDLGAPGTDPFYGKGRVDAAAAARF